MKEDIAKRWSAALRSGKYVQAQKFLADSDRKRHCCLGVLCELAIEDGVELDVESLVEEGAASFDGHHTLLPYAVRRWADVGSGIGRFEPSNSLTNLNDAGKTFAEIAGVIDSAWERL